MGNDYKSTFAEYIRGMLDCRETLGYSRSPHDYILLSFDRYCVENCPDSGELTQETIMPWLLESGTDGLQGRASSVRLLAKYIRSCGREAYVLPDKYFGGRGTKPPYILSDGELGKLFKEIDRLPQTGLYHFRT